MFKRFFEEKKSESTVNKNKATQRLSNYIQDFTEEKSSEKPNTDHLVKPILSRRDDILNRNQQAIENVEREMSNNSVIPTLEIIPKKEHIVSGEIGVVAIEELPKKDSLTDLIEVDPVDYLDADINTILKNIEDDPFADTEEILDKSQGNKFVEVTVVYDEQNYIQSKKYTFETRSFTAFNEQWDEDLYRTGTFTHQDIYGNYITINPTKCYTVERKECKY